MAANAPSEATKNAFRRAYLDAMKSMATVGAYVIGAHYIEHRHHATAIGSFLSNIGAAVLMLIAYVGATFTVDLLWSAFHIRFPHVVKHDKLLWVSRIIAAVIATAPIYIPMFRGGG